MYNKITRTNNSHATIIISILFVCSFLSAILRLEAIRSLCFYISIALVLCVFVMDFVTERLSIALIFLIIFLSCSVLVELKINIDYFKRVIIVFCVFICFTKIKDFSKQSTISIKKIVGVLFLLLALAIELLYYFGGLNQIHHGNTNLITLNMSNPNETGVWTTCVFLILVSSVPIWNNKIIKGIVWIVSLLLLPIIWATGSRNSMIACVIFVFSFIAIKMFRLNKVPNWVIFFVIILPAIVFFVYMYIFIPYLGVFENSLSGLVSEGKDLTSRSEIWQEVLDNFNECFLLGNYYRYFDQQLHNSLATMFVMFGLPTTILMCAIMYKSLKSFSDERSVLSTVALLCVLLTGCFEASLFVGVAGLFLVVLILPIFTESKVTRK